MNICFSSRRKLDSLVHSALLSNRRVGVWNWILRFIVLWRDTEYECRKHICIYIHIYFVWVHMNLWLCAMLYTVERSKINVFKGELLYTVYEALTLLTNCSVWSWVISSVRIALLWKWNIGFMVFLVFRVGNVISKCEKDNLSRSRWPRHIT